MTKAKCIRECIWQGRHWKTGEKYEGAATPPNHFEVIEASEVVELPGDDDEPKRGRRKKENDREE